MIFPGFPGVLSFFQVFQVELEPWVQCKVQQHSYKGGDCPRIANTMSIKGTSYSFSRLKRRSATRKKWLQRNFSTVHTFLKIRYYSAGKLIPKKSQRRLWLWVMILDSILTTGPQLFMSKCLSITKALSVSDSANEKARKTIKCNLCIVIDS